MIILFELFKSFFKIGAFSFGGGYAMLPLIEKEVIDVHSWISSSEFIDIIAISEMTPGPIAINSATFLGYKVAGVMGSAVATFGVALPSFIVMSLIYMFVDKFKNSPQMEWVFRGIRPVVLGMIASAAVSVGRSAFIDIKAVLISFAVFYIVTFKKVNPIFVLVMAGIAGVILY